MSILCSAVAADGLHCGGWPSCIGSKPDDPEMLERCKTKGCWWRAYHSIPADKLTKKPAKPEQGDLF